MKIVKSSDAQTIKNSDTSNLLEYSTDINDYIWNQGRNKYIKEISK